MPKLEDFQSENLFLLIGKNPLPDYVAARMLAKRDASSKPPTLYLVCSAETLEYANKLKDKLGQTQYNCKEIIVDPANQGDIRQEVGKDFPSGGTIGLNYTGGTKAMSVHAYRAIESLGAGRDIKFSYLDPRELKLYFDPRPGSSEEIGFKLGDPDSVDNKPYFERTKITLEDLLYLHGLKKLKRSGPNPRPKPRRLQIVEAMLSERLSSNQWKNTAGKKLKSLLSDRIKNQFGYYPPDEANRDQYEGHLRTQTIALPNDMPKLKATLESYSLVDNGKIDLAKLQSNESAEVFCDFLRGYWLEDHVLGKVLSVAQDCYLHDCGSSLEIGLPFNERRHFFEVDVVALRGYQLFAVSCTLLSKVKDCKQKLFEMVLRARQLGGDEARIALVCSADNREKQNLEDQLRDDRIAVFGKNDWANLEVGLRKWFRGELFR